MQSFTDQETSFYGSYDYITGLRIAGVLGGILLMVIVYTTYKLKCRRGRWSKEDKAFIDKYAKLLTDKWSGKKRLTGKKLQETQWIQAVHSPTNKTSQPLTINGAMYHMCRESLKTGACQTCTNFVPAEVWTVHPVMPGPFKFVQGEVTADKGVYSGTKMFISATRPLLQHQTTITAGSKVHYQDSLGRPQIVFPNRTLRGKYPPATSTSEMLAWNPINFLSVPVTARDDKRLLKSHSMEERASSYITDEDIHLEEADGKSSGRQNASRKESTCDNGPTLVEEQPLLLGNRSIKM